MNPKAWVGWIYFAGALLLAAGGVQIIAGLVGIFHHSYYVVSESALVALNYTTWGWIHLVLGIVLMLAGIGIWAGSTWARIVGAGVTVLAMIANVAFISAYPLWSIVALIIDGFILHALIVQAGVQVD